jgi:hypothetical protein
MACTRPNQKVGLLLLFAAVALPFTGCAWDGNFEILGYTTESLYDLTIRSIRVPIFANKTLQKGLEFQLTQAVIREIQSKTPYKIVQEGSHADTELICTISNWQKNALNINQLGEIRQAELVLTVEAIWRDLRPGRCNQLLSKDTKAGEPLAAPLPGTPSPPVLVQAKGSYAVEVGESNATATKDAIDRLAVNLVSLMEKPW